MLPLTGGKAFPCLVRAGQHGLAGSLGSVRTKKWKPFHNMYRANFLRELRKKEFEAAKAAAADGTQELGQVVTRPNEPIVSTTPFQAARLLRAFNVYSDESEKVTFLTRLNVDLSRESVRGTCNLPHGLKTQIKVLAFCPDEEAEEMLKAGADFAGITDPLRRINQGWLGFDRCFATPAIMPQVMKVAKLLGPRKMMPNPKSGTVVTNLRQVIQEAKSGTMLEFRAEGAGELKATIADMSFSDAKILDNMKFLVQTLMRARPRTGSSTSGGTGGKPVPLIPTQKTASTETKDVYFMEAGLQLAGAGTLVRVDPDSMLPASTGYFR